MAPHPLPLLLSSLSMVASVEITNFRGFERFAVSDLSLINIIVGDNASGKTSFLEAIYLALSGHTQKPMNLKTWRGLESVPFNPGSLESVVDAFYSDLFHDSEGSNELTITLSGRGFETRTLIISKTRGDTFVPTQKLENRHNRRAQKKKKTELRAPVFGQMQIVPIELTWIDEKGTKHVSGVRIMPVGVEFGGTGEQLPTSFFFSAQAPTPPKEVADWFSALQRRRDLGKFRNAFAATFSEVVEISVDTATQVLSVDIPTSKSLVPLPMYSGGTNRFAAILLAIANRHNGLVLVDEIENGLFYARQKTISNALITMARAYETQLFLTTHSDEWIQNFISAVNEKTDDITFWRMERDKLNQPEMRRFTFKEFSEGLAIGEMR